MSSEGPSDPGMYEDREDTAVRIERERMERKSLRADLDGMKATLASVASDVRTLREERARKHIAWTVVAVATLIAVVVLVIFAPVEVGERWAERLLFFAGGLIMPGSPLGGIARRTAAVATGAAILALSLLGCGSVIGTQARIATESLVSVEGIQRFADHGHEGAIAGCATASDRIACIDEADATWIPVGEGADGAGVAIIGWISTLEVARMAEGDVDEALALAMARAVEVIAPAFVLALCAGADLPDWLLPIFGIDRATACGGS